MIIRQLGRPLFTIVQLTLYTYLPVLNNNNIVTFIASHVDEKRASTNYRKTKMCARDVVIKITLLSYFFFIFFFVCFPSRNTIHYRNGIPWHVGSVGQGAAGGRAPPRVVLDGAGIIIRHIQCCGAAAA